MKMVARRFAIPLFVLMFASAIAIDTYPKNWAYRSPLKETVHGILGALGLQQGDWPLFAPNPRIRTGLIVGEILDGEGNTALWVSTDWAKASVWEKFYRARHLNYLQRVIQNSTASTDLADYLHSAIPHRERVEPGIRWTEDSEPKMSDPLVPPVRQIVLYHHLRRIILAPGEPLPSSSDIIWSQKSTFLVKRDYEP